MTHLIFPQNFQQLDENSKEKLNFSKWVCVKLFDFSLFPHLFFTHFFKGLFGLTIYLQLITQDFITISAYV